MFTMEKYKRSKEDSFIIFYTKSQDLMLLLIGVGGKLVATHMTHSIAYAWEVEFPESREEEVITVYRNAKKSFEDNEKNTV